MRPTSDEKLISLIASGDQHALETLYDRYGRRAFALSARILRDESWAQDAVQEAFVSLWKMAGSYRRERGSVSSWILAIVHHRAIDAYRKVKSSAPAGGQIEIEAPAENNVADRAIENLEQRKVREAVDRLPLEQREAILMAYFDGYSHREIASRRRLPLGTVKGRIRLAMDKLRDLLDDRPAGGGS